MIELGAPNAPRRHAVDRHADRIVAVAAIVLALGFLVTALLVVLLPGVAGAGVWLPVHLALAGAASTAIAGVMPFFTAAISASRPVDARLRIASLAAVAGGAGAVTLGFTRGPTGLAVLGGLAFIGGIVVTGYATLAPLRRGLGPRGGIVAVGYGAAIAMVVVGAVLATLYLAGWSPIVAGWAALKPAHAWLNLVGFVSLVIATTLLHFFPTVVGARIARIPVAHATTLGLAAGSALVALGFAAGSDAVTRLGAVVVAVGAASLAIYAALVWRTRNHWHTDAGWHRFAMGGLVSAIVWFEIGMAVTVSRVLLYGAVPNAVDTTSLAAPLIAGWMGLSVLASASHLVPAIGPGDRDAHARQRALLGRASVARLVGADVGIAALALGLALDNGMLVATGLTLVAFAMIGTVILILASLWLGPWRRGRSGP